MWPQYVGYGWQSNQGSAQPEVHAVNIDDTPEDEFQEEIDLAEQNH